MGRGHFRSLPSEPGFVRAGWQIHQTPGKPQQTEELDQASVAQTRGIGIGTWVKASSKQETQRFIQLEKSGRIVFPVLAQGAQQGKNALAENRRRDDLRQTTNKSDARMDRFDTLSQPRFFGDLARKLCDMQAQGFRRVDPRFDVPHVRDREETVRLCGKGMHWKGAKRGGYEILVARVFGDHLLDSFQAFGAWRRRDGVFWRRRGGIAV
jgi:hypothetical protein